MTAEVRAYLDYAGFGRLRPAAVTAMSAALERVLPDGSARVGELFGARATVRDAVARLLECTPAEVALVPNTSTGIHLVADGLDWHPGDRVLLCEGDFPANVRPWLRLERQGVKVDRVPLRGGGHLLEDMASAIGPDTRLVAVSHVNFATGFRCDLDAVCALAAEVGALVSVDAVQSLGALPVSMADTPVDFLAAGAHKWLCGPPGTGVFYCRAERLPLLRTTPTGWFGFEGAADLMKGSARLRYDLPERATAARVEGGMYNILGTVGLAAALAELESVGVAAVTARVLRLSDRIRTGLQERGYSLAGPAGAAARSGIVSFYEPGGDSAAMVADLVGTGIHVSLPDGLVRVSPHYWTNDAEIDFLLSAIPVRRP
jgi:selenocysteine lyase/cysteine desulfurase